MSLFTISSWVIWGVSIPQFILFHIVKGSNLIEGIVERSKWINILVEGLIRYIHILEGSKLINRIGKEIN